MRVAAKTPSLRPRTKDLRRQATSPFLKVTACWRKSGLPQDTLECYSFWMKQTPKIMFEQNAELYSIVDGEMRDAHLHEAILAEGDHDAAVEATREWARSKGWSEAEIKRMWG
jgi:hypothetical protein